MQEFTKGVLAALLIVAMALALTGVQRLFKDLALYKHKATFYESLYRDCKAANPPSDKY